MNNTNCSVSKKEVLRQEDDIPRLILQNSPANILKSARESLKHLDSNKPFIHHKRPHLQLKLPQNHITAEEVSTAKVRPSLKIDTKSYPSPLQPNRARSAFDVKGTPVENRYFLNSPVNTEGIKKLVFPTESDEKNAIDRSDDEANKENSAQKQWKTFIIKHKKPEKGEMGRLTGELVSPKNLRQPGLFSSSACQSPTHIRITHIPSKFSCFKADSLKVRTLDKPEKKEMEEVKSDSYGNFRTASSLPIYKDDEMPQDSEEKTIKPLRTENKKELQKKGSIVLKRDSQVNFNVKLGDVLGEGAYGIVYKALNMETGQFLAAKQIRVSELQNKSSVGLDDFCQEIELYQKLEHENIVPYRGAKQDEEDIYIYMEYMPGGSISSMLKQYGSFEEKVIKKFTRQVVEGLHYLHNQGVIHRDIKGGNILSDGYGNVKLADFGASKHIENPSFATSSMTNLDVCESIKGSLFWMAPELINHEKHGRKIDIWSLGCTVIEMASAKHPWPDVKGFPEFVVAIMTQKCPPIPDHLSETAKDFIRQCCQFDKKLRPKTSELLQHPFLSEDS